MYRSLLIIIVSSLSLGALASSDPTRPAYLRSSKPKVTVKQVKSKPLVALTLNAILYSDNRKVAVINNQALSVGDKIADAVLTQIERFHVVLKRRGRTTRLVLSTIPQVKSLSRHQETGTGR